MTTDPLRPSTDGTEIWHTQIIKELHRRDMSHYDLVVGLEKDIPASTLYRWLADPRAHILAGYIEAVANRLDLRLVVPENVLSKEDWMDQLDDYSDDPNE